MQPYSPHQIQSGAINPPPGDAPVSLTKLSPDVVAAAQAAVDASMDAPDHAVLDVPRQPTPGLSGS